MHTVDDAALEHLERLARLVIEPGERESLKTDLLELLGFVDTLLDAQVDGEEETGEAGQVVDGERPDEVTASLERRDALALAPESDQGYITVPRTVDEG